MLFRTRSEAFSLRVQLFLNVEAWNHTSCNFEETDGAVHVRRLWSLSKEVRILLWSKVQEQGLQLEEFGVDGELDWGGRSCSMDNDEVSVLFSLASLRNLRELHLHGAEELHDKSMEILAAAGCGEHLASLTLTSTWTGTVFSLSSPCVCLRSGLCWNRLHVCPF
mgnify:FL=1